MKYTGLVLDLDKTLIRGKPYSISETDINAIKQLKENNIPVIIATGNTYEKAKAVHSLLDLDTPIISLLGTLITFSDNEISLPINNTTVDLLEEWASKSNKSYTKVYSNGIDYTGSLMMDYLPYNYTEIKNKSEVLQLVFCVENQSESDELLSFITKNNLQCWTYVYPSYVVCISCYTDKGVALRIIGDKLDWDVSEFVAIGNYPSDTPLFDEVAKGVIIRSNRQAIPTGFDIFDPSSKGVIYEIINKYFDIR